MIAGGVRTAQTVCTTGQEPPQHWARLTGLAAHPDAAGTVISPILLMRKQRHREVELLVRGHQQVVKPVLKP